MTSSSKSKVLIIGCNPSEKSPDNSPFHTSTRSRMVIDQWFSEIDADVSFINICDQKRPGNKAFTRKELYQFRDPVFSQLESYKNYKLVTVGKAAEVVLELTGLSFFSMPHPSGLNRQLNDPEFVKEKIRELKVFLDS